MVGNKINMDDGSSTLKSTAPEACGACSHRCMLYIVASFCLPENRSASGDTQAFLRDFSRKDISASQKQHIYRVFMRHMRANRHVKCRVGMFYLEKYTLTGYYRYLMFDEWKAARNQFINNKVTLYQWIVPEFLDAKVSSAYIRDASVFCEMINHVHTPTEKLYCIVEISRLVYMHGGGNMGQEDFLPVFIFTFIHLQTRDLLFNLLYIQRYMPVPAARCSGECTHIGNTRGDLHESCECTIRVPCCSAKEALFYLTNFEAAVVFIERLEYGDLKVDQDTYNRQIARHCRKIDTTRLDVGGECVTARIAKGITRHVSSFLRQVQTSKFWTG